MPRLFALGLISALAASALSGCSADDAGQGGSGTATFTVWGEEFIEDEIPTEEFADGWSVEFDRFLISIGGIYVRDRAGNGSQLEGSWLLDLTQPGPHELGSLELVSKAWPHVGYAVAPVTAATQFHESASQDALAFMEKGGFSVHASGLATKGTVTKTFEWGFTNSTDYDDCLSELDGKEVDGMIVTNGGDENVELTIHGDHFFYDDLASADAVPRFAPIAAADDDGAVSLDDLDAVQLVEIEEGTYGTGSASHVDDLGEFVRALTRTIGHYRGEGHCVETAR